MLSSSTRDLIERNIVEQLDDYAKQIHACSRHIFAQDEAEKMFNKLGLTASRENSSTFICRTATVIYRNRLYIEYNDLLESLFTLEMLNRPILLKKLLSSTVEEAGNLNINIPIVEKYSPIAQGFITSEDFWNVWQKYVANKTMCNLYGVFSKICGYDTLREYKKYRVERLIKYIKNIHIYNIPTDLTEITNDISQLCKLNNKEEYMVQCYEKIIPIYCTTIDKLMDWMEKGSFNKFIEYKE